MEDDCCLALLFRWILLSNISSLCQTRGILAIDTLLRNELSVFIR